MPTKAPAAMTPDRPPPVGDHRNRGRGESDHQALGGDRNGESARGPQPRSMPDRVGTNSPKDWRIPEVTRRMQGRAEQNINRVFARTLRPQRGPVSPLSRAPLYTSGRCCASLHARANRRGFDRAPDGKLQCRSARTGRDRWPDPVSSMQTAHVFEDTAAMGRRMPKIYRDWKYAHGIFANQPWFPPLGPSAHADGYQPARRLRRRANPSASSSGWPSSTPPASRARCCFPTNGLTMGHIANSDYAIAVARAYNDWLAETYVDRSEVFKGMGLIAPAGARRSGRGTQALRRRTRA